MKSATIEIPKKTEVIPEPQKLLSGTQIIARAAWEAGVEIVSGYPGTPTTGILEAAKKYDDIQTLLAANEKVATEIAIGASYSGKRSMVVMKHVGLNVAADPFFNLAYTGVRGGLVVVVGDDPGAKSSQNEQDSRELALAAGVPVLEPSSLEELKKFTKLAFELSEKCELPVLLRVVSRQCFSSKKIFLSPRINTNPMLGFALPVSRFLLLPVYVPERHRVRNQNLTELAQSNDLKNLNTIYLSDYLDRLNFNVGIVASGHCYSKIVEIFGDAFPIFKLSLVNPLPIESLKVFQKLVSKIIVADEGSSYLNTQIRALGIPTLDRPNYKGFGILDPWELATNKAPEIKDYLVKKFGAPISKSVSEVPPRVPGFCSGCTHTGIYQVLKELNIYAVGDIGCNTLGALPPFNVIKSNLCMSASLGVLQGYETALGPEFPEKAVAVLGDSTFFHSGIPALVSLINQKSRATIIILDNSGSAMTGMQKTNPNFDEKQWSAFLSGIGVPRYKILDALDMTNIKKVLINFLNSSELCVILLKGNCVQESPKKTSSIYRYVINKHACTECGKCMETNCPSIEMKNNKSIILSNCEGCGFCPQICPEGAIMPLSVNYLVGWSKSLSLVASKIKWPKLIRNLRSIFVLDWMFEKIEKSLTTTPSNKEKKI